MPWTMRKTTISGRVEENPHSIDDSTKPAMATMNTMRRPTRSDTQPVNGVAMAEATIYDVSTQVISSCVAFRLEAMWGRATLAMVVSSTCITVATMIDAVSNAGLRP